MDPIEFKSAQVARDGGRLVVIALFDGAPVPAAVAILRCDVEAAEALLENLGSALRTPMA